MDNRIITTDLKQYISIERLNELREIAKKEKTYLNNRYGITSLKDILDRKAIEITYKYSRYQDLNNIEKAIIANNIVFDSEKFANILNNGNFDKKSLQAFLKLVNYFINNSGNNLTETDKRYLEITDKFKKKLINHFKKQVGVTDISIIINKLNEVLSFEPELLEDKVNKHTR